MSNEFDPFDALSYVEHRDVRDTGPARGAQHERRESLPTDIEPAFNFHRHQASHMSILSPLMGIEPSMGPYLAPYSAQIPQHGFVAPVPQHAPQPPPPQRFYSGSSGTLTGPQEAQIVPYNYARIEGAGVQRGPRRAAYHHPSNSWSGGTPVRHAQHASPVLVDPRSTLDQFGQQYQGVVGYSGPAQMSGLARYQSPGYTDTERAMNTPYLFRSPVQQYHATMEPLDQGFRSEYETFSGSDARWHMQPIGQSQYQQPQQQQPHQQQNQQPHQQPQQQYPHEHQKRQRKQKKQRHTRAESSVTSRAPRFKELSPPPVKHGTESRVFKPHHTRSRSRSHRRRNSSRAGDLFEPSSAPVTLVAPTFVPGMTTSGSTVGPEVADRPPGGVYWALQCRRIMDMDIEDPSGYDESSTSSMQDTSDEEESITMPIQMCQPPLYNIMPAYPQALDADPQPRTRKQSKYTAEQDNMILNLKIKGKSWAEIASLAGCQNQLAARNRYQVLIGQQGGGTFFWTTEDCAALQDTLDEGERAKWLFIAEELTRQLEEEFTIETVHYKVASMFAQNPEQFGIVRTSDSKKGGAPFKRTILHNE